MTDIDEAYAMLGFGRMQICILLTCVLLQIWATNEQVAFGVVVAAATCDLQISNLRVGWLMSCNFTAQMLLALFWGEMGDRYGRRKTILIGGPGALFASLLSVCMPEFWSFMVMRVLTGAFLGGPVGVLMTYLGELTRVSLRPKVLNYLSYAFGVSMIQVPALATVILPLDMGFLKSWRILQLTSTIPGILGLIAMVFLPESPKYYLSINQEAKALKDLERICRCNKGKGVTLASLGIESLTQPRLQTLNAGMCNQAKTLLTKYLRLMALMSIIILVLCGIGIGLPVWMMRIRVITLTNGNGRTVCEHLHGMTAGRVIKCELSSTDIIDSIIHGFVLLGIFIITSLLLFVASRRILVLVFIVIAVIGSLALNFVTNHNLILVCFFALIDPPLSSVRLAMTLIIDLIPTHLRGRAMAIIFMMGRLGILLINLFMGYSLGWNCHFTFNTFLVLLVGSFILVFMLPTERRIRSLAKI